MKREFPGIFSSEKTARLFDLPADGYVRYAPEAGAEPSNADVVELRPEFEAALFRLYAEFGVPLRAPATFGELMGAHSYCTVLFNDNAYPRINPEDDAMWLAAADDTLTKYSPELLPAVRAYRAGDKAELERFGREFLTPRTLSWHYVEAYKGWAGDPYLKEQGIAPPNEPTQKNQPRMRLVE